MSCCLDNNMSDREEQQQQWIVVKPSKKKHIKKNINPNRIHAKGVVPLSTVFESDAEQQFLASKATQYNRQLLKSYLQNGPQQLTVQCLGLGNFQANLKPHLQFIFLKKIIIPELERLKISFEVNVYDPIFDEEEITQINKQKWSCKPFEQVENSKNCLLFMPHCERQLYENVLRNKKIAQWWLVIGNSITQYKERCKMLGENIPSVIGQFSPKEQQLKDHKQAFNDTVMYLL